MSESKISPTPWHIDPTCRGEIFDNTDERNRRLIAKTFFHNGSYNTGPWLDTRLNDATAIVSAVNNSYGAGINPDSVPELFRTLKNMVEYFEWLIKDPDFPAYREAKEAILKAKIK